MTITAIGWEIVHRYYSSPTPVPGLGRTVPDSGADGQTLYISSEAHVLFLVGWAISVVTLIALIFLPLEERTVSVKKLQSECLLPATGAQSGSALTLRQSERLIDSPSGNISYLWQPEKGKSYIMVALVIAMATGVWISQWGQHVWWPRIIMLGIALWILRLLIEYRTSIDGDKKIILRERFLFGRYRIGVELFPFSEFTGIALDRYEDQDDSTTTFYVCLRLRNGRLRQVCYFEVPTGQRSPEAEQAALELARVTGLPCE